jgi:UPF0716 protein FxsA
MTSVVLFLMFTVLPAIELWLIITVGERVGAWQTVLTLVLAGVLGSWLGKRAGFQVVREIFDGLRQGIPPADKLVEAGLVLVGAVLLITPGYVSDVVGLVLFVGPVRRFLAPHIKNLAWKWLLRRGLSVGPATAGPGAPPPSAPKPPAEPPHFQHPVA